MFTRTHTSFSDIKMSFTVFVSEESRTFGIRVRLIIYLYYIHALHKKWLQPTAIFLLFLLRGRGRQISTWTIFSHFCGQCYGFVSHTRLLLIQCVGFHLCVFFTCVYFYNICVCVSSLVSFSIRNKK